jgi:curved DNA-binding protein CbpA
LPDARVRTPKLVLGRGDLRGTALSPTDGFVLSRIDGASDEQEIVAVTGLPEAQVQACLAKLESLGVVTFEAARAPAPVPAPQPATANESQGRPALTDDPTALAEDVDLDIDMRRQILATHGALERLDHYALLGVDRAADKKTLRRAYFELAAKFHPDRYFRKRLGSFKPRMETIFGRLTLAHETVSTQDSRAEYDAYLSEQRRARSIEELLDAAVAEAKRAEESIERELRGQTPMAAATSSAPPAGSAIGPAPRPSATPSPAIPATTTPVPTAMDVAARRDMLARRLLGGRGAAGSSSSPPAPRTSLAPPPTPTVAEAMESLRRRYEDRVALAKAAQARRYLAHGEEALARGDAIAAATALRIAVSLSPTDQDLARKAHDAQTKADTVLSETYTRQAAYEEKTGQWTEAARSWSRVCKARPSDPDAHCYAANAIVKAAGDLHEAARLAERACTLEPKTARYRVALANVYIAAGLALNARRELDAAAQLAPHDGTIKEMIGRIGSKE